MNPADDEETAKSVPTEGQSSGAVAGSGEDSDQQLRALLENLQRVGRQPTPGEEDEPVERDDLRPGFTSYLDQEASERKAIYDRLVAIEAKLKTRGSRGFARYLVAILVGVAATLAWQSYGDAAKQVIATRAPELGWSPGAKQMIASSIQWIGLTKSPAGSEKQAPPVAQTAPPAPSIDPAQVQQMAQNLAALRQNVDQLTAGQDQMARQITRLESAVAEVILKMPEPPPQPPAAPARKPTPTAPPSSSRTPIPPRLPPHP